MSNNLLAEARSYVATTIAVTGLQVSDDMQERAGDLLAAIWSVSFSFGVQPEDWAATNARLPRACVDVLAAVERRPRFDLEPGHGR